MVARDHVESALEVPRPSLAIDGFDLRVGEPVGDVVRVVLAAKLGACLDCLVPDAMLTQFPDDAIRGTDPSLDRVELVKEGFDALTGH
jgi:hypothetical protein